MRDRFTKRLNSGLLIGLAAAFLLLPVVTTFDHLLTRSLNGWGNVAWVQKYIVPHEAKIVAVILKPMGFNVLPTPNGIYVNGVLVTIWWSCVGWQAMIVSLISFWPGFGAGRFTKGSKAETVVLGALSFFFLTVVRLVSVAMVGAWWGTRTALLYHDIFAASLLTYLWLFGFWWFCYKFILEEQSAGIEK